MAILIAKIAHLVLNPLGCGSPPVVLWFADFAYTTI